ncbi:MAG: M48 family metallopeptidase, partial [Planctomycetes bacterium]|nr:M48 family metallopeptidase [Planctomycetota bacterium]
MDFFARQDHARRASRWLVVLFVLSVIAIVSVTNVAAYYALSYQAEVMANRTALHVVVTVLTLCAIGVGSAIKIAQLSGGGSVAAEMMGAKRLNDSAASAEERTLLHVVEEMSIASGVPMPLVYVIEEDGLNAFAAGHRPSDAVIAVTRGCLARMDRAELQGVVAHEFSHLLNGDMHLNLRLIGLLSGILVIGETGRVLMRMCGWSNDGSRRDRGVIIWLLGAGIVLFVIGYVGYFFGRLIKAAINREREYLADASAVQFTRNPAGVAGALKKVGDRYGRSAIHHPRAEEFSHLFFGQALASSWLGLLASHPPLRRRIRAVDPRWDGTWPEVAPIEPPPRSELEVSGPARSLVIGAEQIAARIGRFSPEHIAYGAALLANLPSEITAASRDPFSARAAILALLIDARPAIAELQWQAIAGRDPSLATETRRLHPIIAPLGDAARLPLFDLSMPALRSLGAGQRIDLLALVADLVSADQELT